MNAYQLTAKLRGEIVANRAIATVDGAKVVIAQVVDSALTLTSEGEALVAAHASKPRKAAVETKAAAEK